MLVREGAGKDERKGEGSGEEGEEGEVGEHAQGAEDKLHLPEYPIKGCL